MRASIGYGSRLPTPATVAVGSSGTEGIDGMRVEASHAVTMDACEPQREVHVPKEDDHGTEDGHAENLDPSRPAAGGM